MLQAEQPQSGIIQAPSGVDISPLLPKEFLEKLGQMVTTRKQTDWGDAEGYRALQKRHIELFSGKIPGKTVQDDTVMYVHLPYITKAALLYHGKMHSSSFPATGDIVAASTMRPGSEDKDRAVTRCMNFVLRYWVEEYIACHDRGSLDTLLYGSAFSIWRWSSTEERPTFDFATTDTVIVPYAYHSNRPDMSDVPWFTWILRMPRHEIEMAADKGDFNPDAVKRMYDNGYNEDGTAPPEPQEAAQNTAHEAADRVFGLNPSVDAPSRDRCILWHHCWVALPGETRQRPLEVFCDETTKVVVRVSLREKEDAADVRRYNAEVLIHKAAVDSQTAMHEQAMAQFQQTELQHERMIGQMALEGVPPAELPPPPNPPEPPVPPPAPRAPKRVPFSRITHYMCIPNPEGFYGYGIGILVEGHNIVADETMSLYTSNLRQSLSPTGIFSHDARMPRGEFNLTLGKWTEVNLPPEQIQGAFRQIVFPAPDPNAFKVEQRQAQAVSEITADPILLGEAGKSGQTATETDIRSSNAMTPIATVSARYNRSRMNELKVLAHLLSEMLPEDGFRFYNYDQMGAAIAPEGFLVKPSDFGDELAMVFTTDPHLSSQPQRERSAMRALDTVQKGLAMVYAGTPPVDPLTGVKMIRTAIAKVFTAMDLPQMAQMITEAPLPPDPRQQPTGGPPNGPGEPTGEPGASRMEGAEPNPPPPEAPAGGPQ